MVMFSSTQKHLSSVSLNGALRQKVEVIVELNCCVSSFRNKSWAVVHYMKTVLYVVCFGVIVDFREVYIQFPLLHHG